MVEAILRVGLERGGELRRQTLHAFDVRETRCHRKTTSAHLIIVQRSPAADAIRYCAIVPAGLNIRRSNRAREAAHCSHRMSAASGVPRFRRIVALLPRCRGCTADGSGDSWSCALESAPCLEPVDDP